jgi:hypothetical protein
MRWTWSYHNPRFPNLWNPAVEKNDIASACTLVSASIPSCSSRSRPCFSFSIHSMSQFPSARINRMCRDHSECGDAGHEEIVSAP